MSEVLSTVSTAARRRDAANAAIARWLYALAIAALGAQAIVTCHFVPGLQPVADVWPALAAHRALAAAGGLVLVGGAFALIAPRTRRAGGLAIAAMFALALVGLHAKLVLAHPHDGGERTVAVESLALAMGAWLALGPANPAVPRVVFGLTLPVFGHLHFVYNDYVAAVQPGWIPAHMFFTYATAIALIAAGLAIATGVLGRLAATLTAAMFGLWVAILHAPRVVDAPHSETEWTSMFIALGFCGAAWLAALTFPPASPKSR